MTGIVPFSPPKVLRSAGSGPTAIQQIFECQHILDSIVGYATRRTQIVCLRTSFKLYLAAGPPLYRTVKIDGDNMIPFLHGSLIGIAKEDIDCNFQTRIGGCKKGKNGKKDKDESGHPPVPNVNVYATALTAVSVPSYARETISSAAKKKTKKTTHEKKKPNKQASGHPPLPNVNGDHIVSGQKKTKKTTHEKKKPNKQASGSKAPITNFKTRLLGYVKVLTVGSHQHYLCDKYGPYAHRLFSRIDILRIVSSVQTHCKLDVTCDKGCDICPLFTTLQPRKIVLRDLDGKGACVPNSKESKRVPSLEEAVYFIPVYGRHRRQGDRLSFMNFGNLFERVPKVKIIFYSEWEGWDSTTDGLWGDIVSGWAGLTVDHIVYTVQNIAQHLDRKCTIYGLEKLPLMTGGDLAGIFSDLFPRVRLTRPKLREITRHELCHGTLRLNLDRYRDEPDVEYETDYPEHFEYKTLKEYVANIEDRHGEINASD